MKEELQEEINEKKIGILRGKEKNNEIEEIKKTREKDKENYRKEKRQYKKLYKNKERGK